MKEESTNPDSSSLLKRHTRGLTVTWTTVIAASLIWNINLIEQEILDTAHLQAQAAYEKDSLFLKNPAFMTRQTHELAEKEWGILGHITSLKPRHP